MLFPAAITGLLSGFSAGLLGIGGGLFFVPMTMTMFSGHGIHAAIATSAGFTLFAGLSSFITHRKKAHPLLNSLVFILVGSIFGALAGPKIALMIPAKPLTLFFIPLVFLPYAMRSIDIKLRPTPVVLGVCGFVIGTTAACFGIGGGVLLVPLLSKAFGFNLRSSITTSSLFILINSSIATAVYSISGMVSWDILLFAVPCGIIAAGLGAWTSHWVSIPVLNVLMALASLTICLKMGLSLVGG
ncbi:MAG: sulfite exporter TauE/SafE family protein [Thermodesulfobacteriota bacterium]|nr:sulfite exporter TauE/SafE family protein [Thermodesulfobacteriota bacterium]